MDFNFVKIRNIIEYNIIKMLENDQKIILQIKIIPGAFSDVSLVGGYNPRFLFTMGQTQFGRARTLLSAPYGIYTRW